MGSLCMKVTCLIWVECAFLQVLYRSCFCKGLMVVVFVTPGHRGNQLKISRYRKRTDIWHLVFLGKKVLFKESPPGIMVTRNPNWSIEILWYETGYTKGKILSPLTRPP